MSVKERAGLLRRSRDRGINFVRLNKEVIYPSQRQITSPAEPVRKLDPMATTVQSFMP
jgi:hypothetical protein